MPIFADRLSAEAMSVEFIGDLTRVVLTDGPEISAPLEWFPRLRSAVLEAERANWRLIGRGEGVHWPDLDEDVSVNAPLGLPTCRISAIRSIARTLLVFARFGRNPAPPFLLLPALIR